MITARMLLDRMTPSTIIALLQDMREVEDDQDDAGEPVKVKALPIRYANFARRVNRRHWRLIHAGPGSFHFERK